MCVVVFQLQSMILVLVVFEFESSILVYTKHKAQQAEVPQFTKYDICSW